VPEFIVQDDAAGPFQYLQFFDRANPPFDTTLQRDDYSTGVAQRSLTRPREPEFSNLQAVVVPLPPRVTLSFGIAEARAIKWLEAADTGTNANELLVRTYLRTSSDFKAGLPASGEPFCSLRFHPMPKWLWITEVAWADNYAHSPEGFKVIGWILQDAAGHGFGDDEDEDAAPPDADLVAVALDETFALYYADGSQHPNPSPLTKGWSARPYTR
jgi:hypothetical protein